MAIKAVEVVRKIRDKHVEETKGLSLEDQIEFIKMKSAELQKKLKRGRGLPADNRAQRIKV